MISLTTNSKCWVGHCAEIARRAWERGGVALVAGVLLLSGCGETTKPQTLNYNIYVGSTQTNQLYVLDPDSLTVRDSIPGLGRSFDLVVSRDGRWLYVEANPDETGNNLTKVDVLTKQQVASLPSMGGTRLAMVLDGKWILRGARTYEEIIDPGDLTLLRKVSDSLPWRDGPDTGNKIAVGFYPGGLEGPSLIRILDLETGELTGSYTPHLQSGEPVGAYQVMLLSDSRRVIVAGPRPEGCWVVVGDAVTGETLLQFRRPACQGEIAISLDGSFAVVSDPSSIGHPEAPEPGIDVIGLRTLSHLKRFTPADFGINSWDNFSQVCFTADSRKVIVAPRQGTPGWVHLIDLAALRVEDVVWPPTGFAWIGALGYGPQSQ